MDDKEIIVCEAHARLSPAVIQIRDPAEVSSKSPPDPGLGFPSIETRAGGENDTHLHLTPAQSQDETEASAQTREWSSKLIVWKYLTVPIEA